MNKNLIKSYARINLSLHVLRKDKNRFHKIQSIITFLNFHDKIYIQQINKKKHLVKFALVNSKLL